MSGSDWVPLQCPRCHADLAGDRPGRVFFCRGCRLGWEIEEEAFHDYPLFAAVPLLSRNLPAIYFPFWELSAQVMISGTRKKQKRGGPRRFFVPAFFIRKIEQFGDIGLFYTRNQTIAALTEPGKIPIFPASRTSRQSLAFPAIYLKFDLAKRLDILGAVVNVHAKAERLILVPFYVSDSHAIDSLLGWSYPQGILA